MHQFIARTCMSQHTADARPGIDVKMTVSAAAGAGIQCNEPYRLLDGRLGIRRVTEQQIHVLLLAGAELFFCNTQLPACCQTGTVRRSKPISGMSTRARHTMSSRANDAFIPSTMCFLLKPLSFGPVSTMKELDGQI